MEPELDEIESVLRTIGLYQEGHYRLDAEKLRQAFHPKAHVVGYHAGKLTFLALEDYIEDISKDTSSEELCEAPDTQIVSLDKTETSVVAKIESEISGGRYTSYLAMIKAAEGWKIVNGLFHGESEQVES